MRLDEIANSGFKQNRNVQYEKPPKAGSHAADYHYQSGNGSVSPIQLEKESKTLIDQPSNTRAYHHPSGPGLSPIRSESKYIVGGRTERKRDVIDLPKQTVAYAKMKASGTRIDDPVETVTDEPRDFNRGYNLDKYMIGSIENKGKPQKEYTRFIRPASRLANQSISTKDSQDSISGSREYHYPSGKGFTTETGKSVNPNAQRGYRYPSGKGEVSPIVGKVLAGRSARSSSNSGKSDFSGKFSGSLKVGTEMKKGF